MLSLFQKKFWLNFVRIHRFWFIHSNSSSQLLLRVVFINNFLRMSLGKLPLLSVGLCSHTDQVFKNIQYHNKVSCHSFYHSHHIPMNQFHIRHMKEINSSHHWLYYGYKSLHHRLTWHSYHINTLYKTRNNQDSPLDNVFIQCQHHISVLVVYYFQFCNRWIFSSNPSLNAQLLPFSLMLF